jgi:hypothetical protein
MVAEDERAGTSRMITVDVPRQGLAAIGADDPLAALEPSEVRRASAGVADGEFPGQVRAFVELVRRFGGLTARALVGGAFTAGGDQALIEVSVTQETGAARPVRSHLGRHLYTAGLPAEFADAVLQGLLLAGNELPAGILIIDRGAVDDEGSSSVVFRQAAQLLREVLLVLPQDEGAMEERVRAVMATW